MELGNWGIGRLGDWGIGRLRRSSLLREALQSVARDSRVSTLIVADRFAQDFQRPRRSAALAGGVALLAVVLSIVGLSGVTIFSVRARTREIGIRMALGARGADVVHLLVRDGM